jgi:hypothetical protein
VPERAVVTDADDGALEIVEADVAERLRPVCTDWPEDRFNRLVHDVALSTLRFGIARATFELLRKRYQDTQRRMPEMPKRRPPSESDRL